jgi:CPA2 family monovalent cation:H+ antiporter-2
MMTGAVDLSAYKETLLFLTTAGVVVPLFHRIRVSPVLGFLAAGVALGPFGLGRLAKTYPWLDAVTISSLETIEPIAEFGVVFLLFMIGLELSWERLSRMRRLVFGLGPLQVAASAALVAVSAWGLGLAPVAALIIGSALALSSTAIVVPVLAESKRLASTAGRASFAVLLFQDLTVAPLLVMVAILAARKSGAVAASVLLGLVPAALALFCLAVAGRLVLRPLFRLVAAARSTELFMATCLLVIIGAGLFAALSGWSMGLGAFIAGLLLAETEFRREVEVTIEPFKGLLLGLFFVSVGASLDLRVVAEAPLQLVGLVLGLVAIKAAVLLALAFAFRLPARVGREMALVLGPGGEFAFVMITAGTAASLVEPRTGQAALVVVTLSMMLIPVLARLGERLGRQTVPEEAIPPFALPPPDTGASPVIIVGYGRVGQLVGEMLRRHDLPYLAVDTDPRLVAAEREAGKAIVFGNATRADFLRRCGIGEARALVVTMDAPRAVEEVVRVARGERPDLTIVARARDTRHARALYALGVTDAVPETIEASLQLSEAVLVDLGVPMGYVIASIHDKRDEFRKLLNSADAGGRAMRAIRRPSARRERPPRAGETPTQ